MEVDGSLQQPRSVQFSNGHSQRAGFGRIRRERLSGRWRARLDGYDVVAKAGRDTTYSQMKPMLQSLLADRFKLKLHRANRELPVYELSVMKGGPKIVLAKQG